MRKLLAISAVIAMAMSVGFGNEATAKEKTYSRAPVSEVRKDPVIDEFTKLGETIGVILQNYVDDPDGRVLAEAGIRGILSALDPHSFFLNKQERVKFRTKKNEGNERISGVGLEMTQRGHLVEVVMPVAGSPAERAGIMPGDAIIAVNDTPVYGASFPQVLGMMGGPTGTPVKLTIMRGTEQMEFALTRAEIRISSVRSRKESDDIAYIRITQFDERTAADLKAVIISYWQDIPPDTFKGYILDLRNNAGGLTKGVVETTAAFVEKGKIVSMRGRIGVSTYSANPNEVSNLTSGNQVVVLINGGSASGSEIVAGALQDHKRATLIGTRSFGKGTEQYHIPLSSGNGMLVLTTSRFYRPSGLPVQAIGVKPDMIVLQDVPDEWKDRDEIKGEASLPQHLKNGDGVEAPAEVLHTYVPLDPAQDKALIAAVRFLHGEWVVPSSPK